QTLTRPISPARTSVVTGADTRGLWLYSGRRRPDDHGDPRCSTSEVVMSKKTGPNAGTDVSLTELDVRADGVPLSLAVGRALFLWALDPIMLTQPDTGAILDANPAACRTLGLSVDEIRT